MKKSIGKIRKIVSSYCTSLKEKIFLNKKEIIKVFIGLIAVSILSTSIEYFVFARNNNAQNGAVVVELQKESIQSEGFVKDENGNFVSQSENSTLIIQNDEKFINDLEIYISNNTNNSLYLNYFKNGQEHKKENNLQKSILKSGNDFMPFLIFHINDNPEKIEIKVQNAGTKISKIIVDNEYNFNSYRFLFVFFIGSMMFLMVFFRRVIIKEPAFGFLILSIFTGFLLIVTEPKTFISWDERIHYKNADSYTFKSIIKKDVDDIFAKTNYVPYSYSIKEQSEINNFFDHQFKKQASKKSFDFDFSLKEFYNKMAYWPSALAILIGRMLNIPQHIIFSLGRIANLICYSVIVFFAIKKLRNGKMIMAVVALFPTSLFLASNYSYDYWVNAFTMLGLAYLFNELGQPQKKITRRNSLIMVGSFVVGLGPKAIYFPLMFLPLMIKREKFESGKEYKKFIQLNVIAAVIVLASFLLPFLISGEGGSDMRGGKDVNSAQQVKFILTQPLEYVKIIDNFLSEYLSYNNAIGYTTSFAYLGSFAGSLVLYVLAIFVSITDRKNSEKEVSNWKFKSLMLMVFSAIVILITTALYVAFTPVRSRIINGVQARYLIPVIFPFLYVMLSSRLKNPFPKGLYIYSIFTILTIVNLYGIWNLVVKFYF